jgi:sulfonate transport system ATP-binding protein
MPWLTVEKNILFAHLKNRGKKLPYEKSGALLELLGLAAYRNAYPRQLSGGMAQRAALGRALCYEPELILMDEPLGALDYFTRKSLQDEILKLHLSQKKTILFVTHDVEEALLLSSRIVVLDGGRLIREIPVDMPHPRRQTDPKFAETLDLILSQVHSRRDRCST